MMLMPFLKDFLLGAAHCLDLGGTLFTPKISADPWLTDRQALESDWRQVGKNISAAIGEWERERKGRI